MCEKGVLLKPVLYLSHYFKRHRETYYALLQKTRDEGAWEDWLAFFLDGVAEVSRQAPETARRILALREAHRQSVTEQLGRAAGNGHRVLESLYKRPILSVNAAKELTGTSYAAANQLVERLVTIGVLREMTRGGCRRRSGNAGYGIGRAWDGFGRSRRVIADLKPYPAYKDSGVPWLGEVPEHWEVRHY